MDFTSSPTTRPTPVTADSVAVNAASIIDPFLLEALQNTRHRLTILRMELDIQKFLRNPDQQQFEFQHFPTSYLRLAAHRVAQHYGLQTMVQDNNFLEGQGNRIVVRKMTRSLFPAVCLSEIPVKQPEIDKHEQIKIVIRPRPKTSSNGTSELGKRSSIRTVEERKEEYDRARARIFSGLSSPDSKDSVSQTTMDGNNVSQAIIEGKNAFFNGDECEGSRNAAMDLDKNCSVRDGSTSSRVAIFRDREKDRIDPDYDRSYERYVKNLPSSQNFNLTPLNIQKFQPPYIQYDSVFPPQLGQMPHAQASLSYRSPVMSPYCAIGTNQTSREAVYMQWPSHAMMYAQSYDQFKHALFQAPFCQQPLSFDYSQNH